MGKFKKKIIYRTVASLLSIALCIGGWLLCARMLLPSTDETVELFHNRFNARDFGYIYDEMTSREFRRAVEYEPYRAFMQKAYSAIGESVKTRRASWGLFYSGPGLIFNIGYISINENGGAKEYFSLVKRKGAWKILLYDIKPVIVKK